MSTPASTSNLSAIIQSHGPFLPLRRWIPIRSDSTLGRALIGNLGGYPGGACEVVSYGKGRVTALMAVFMLLSV